MEIEQECTEVSPAEWKYIRKDAIVVKRMVPPEKKGRFYVPDSCRKSIDNRRNSTWFGKIVRFGSKIDIKQWSDELKIGDVVALSPESFECPAYTIKNGDEFDRYVFVRDEDILAKEVV